MTRRAVRWPSNSWDIISLFPAKPLDSQLDSSHNGLLIPQLKRFLPYLNSKTTFRSSFILRVLIFWLFRTKIEFPPNLTTAFITFIIELRREMNSKFQKAEQSTKSKWCFSSRKKSSRQKTRHERLHAASQAFYLKNLLDSSASPAFFWMQTLRTLLCWNLRKRKFVHPAVHHLVQMQILPNFTMAE